MRRSVGNFFDNLTYPVTIVNQVLQGKPRQAGTDTGRFLVNSTIGILGLFDPATRMGIPYHEEDFGQTFAVWGIGRGYYLVLPFMGPSTTVDAVGSGVGGLMYPLAYAENGLVRYGSTGLYALNLRAALLDADGLISGDSYIFLREVYLQRRHYLIMDGEVEDPFMDGWDEDWDEDQEEDW